MNKTELLKNNLLHEKISSEESSVHESPRSKNTRGRKVAEIALIILLVIVIFRLRKNAINVGATAMLDSYETAFSTEKDAAYQTYYDRAEEKYRVSNQTSITIGTLTESSELEVLKVSDIEYIIEESIDNKDNIVSWLEVPGQGTYVVNLQAAEFVVNNEHNYVLVRIPYPELKNISIDYANVNKLLFKNDLLNESYRVGEELAHKQLNSAEILIKGEFASNQHFYLSAQEAAVSTVQYLVKQLNPGIEDLTVEVEFLETEGNR